MTETSPLLSVESLRSFSILENLTREQLGHLAESLTVHTAGTGAHIVERGTDGSCNYLLLKGQVKLVAGDGRIALVKEDSPAANRPLSQLRPRMYDVIAASNIHYLCIDEALLSEILNADKPEMLSDAERGALEVADAMELETEGELCFRLYQDLNADQLVLPSLPDVAMKIRKAVEDEVSDAKRIAALIQADPAITAKLIRTANSPLYRGREPFTTCSAAVVRLGINATHKLVTSFAMGELFKVKSKILQKRMRESGQGALLSG